MFADVAGSTSMRLRLGERSADDWLRRVDICARSVVCRFGGRVIKSLGDGILASFPAASTGLDAAAALHRGAARLPRRGTRLRIGVACGDVGQDGDDISGLPVVVAARLCRAAAPETILTTHAVVELANGRQLHRVGSLGLLDVAGLPEPLAVCTVSWKAPGDIVDPQMQGRLPQTARPAVAELRLIDGSAFGA
jgi:class 3 adenylate cyclase